MGINGDPFQIVGVVPDSTAIAAGPADAWAPLAIDGESGRSRQAFYLGVIGRLRPAVTIAQADDDVRRVSARVAELFPKTNRDLSARVVGLRSELTSGLRPTLFMLSAGAGLVLLIACANLVGLQLARHASRRRELAMRSALGASRPRIVRELCLEGLCMASIAAYAGLTLGMWALATLAHFSPAALARDISARPDVVVIGYAILLAAISGFSVSALPALRATGAPLAAALGARGSGGDQVGTRLRSIVVAAEVAMAVVLMIGAALLSGSLLNVLRVNPGFDFSRGVVVDLVLPDHDYPTTASKAAFFDRVIDAVDDIPGVQAACVISQAPLDGRHGGMTFVPDGESRLVGATPLTVSPQCLELLHIPVKRGRMFTRNDAAGSAALVSESIARELFDGAEPIGRRIHIGLPSGPLLTVVGVVGDIRPLSLESRFANQVWMTYRAGRLPATAVAGAGLNAAGRARSRNPRSGPRARPAAPGCNGKDDGRPSGRAHSGTPV